MNSKSKTSKRSFLCATLLGAALVLASHQSIAQSGTANSELTLYGVSLKDVAIPDFLAAARKAGAKQLKSGNGIYEFDAKKTGVPALNSFTLLTDESSVVVVQFKVDAYEGNENLRNMLVSKYGPPKSDQVDITAMMGKGFGRPPVSIADSFTKQYASDGTYTWDFLGGMQLIYKKGFGFDNVSLSYKDVEKFNRLMKDTKSANDRDVKSKAGALGSKF